MPLNVFVDFPNALSIGRMDKSVSTLWFTSIRIVTPMM